MAELTSLTEGTPIIYDGNKIATVDAALAQAFSPGDRIVVVNTTGALLHIPADQWRIAADAVGRAASAFAAMGSVPDSAISAFFHEFADRLADDTAFSPIAAANDVDVAQAKAVGRSTTRLVLSDRMRADMIEGLRAWASADSGRGQAVDHIEHAGWAVDVVRAGLGVVGFVFEGRPNVFADACGVIRSGNTVVFRIGSDALGTARAIVEHALDPALAAAGLPAGAASLVASPGRAAGWAMFSDNRLSLAVARGSGRAVEQLGAVARQAGISVSLHGTGGAWIVAADDADETALGAAIQSSLDRKVCNTVNNVVVTEASAERHLPVVLAALRASAAEKGTNPKLHVLAGHEHRVPADWTGDVPIARAEGDVVEPQTEPIAETDLGTEWEWENSPEISLIIASDVDDAARLYNAYSPHFVVSLISSSADAHDRFFEMVDAPFVGNGFTRWVDGQYALNRPELGLSNWEAGRLFGRAGVLSGDSVFTLRTRVTQTDPNLRR